MNTANASTATELLDCQGLANKLGKSRFYVTAMKRAGYEFELIAPNLTTIDHAKQWLKDHPDFRAFDYQKEGWRRVPKLSSPSK